MTDLVTIDTLTPAIFSEPGGIDALLSKVERDVRAVEIDVSTKAGREAANSLAYKISRSKTALDQLGKELVADWKAKAKLVDDERKTIRDRLDALKAEVKQPVDDWEKAEDARIAGHLNAITEIDDLTRFEGEPSSAAVAQRLAVLATITGEDRDWQEFADQATAMVKATADKLAAIFEGAVKRERDAAELEALRAEKAERERRDHEAEQARLAEIAKAQAEEAASEQRKRNEEAAKERERIAAERAIEAERQRVAAEQAAERAAAEKRERNKKHRAKVMAEATEAIVDVVIKQAALVGVGFDQEAALILASEVVD